MFWLKFLLKSDTMVAHTSVVVESVCYLQQRRTSLLPTLWSVALSHLDPSLDEWFL